MDSDTDGLVSLVELDELDVMTITDDELTALALAADPDVAIADDAVPFQTDRDRYGDLLPEWYMPAPAPQHVGRPRALVGGVIILSLILVNAVGLCVTYGSLEIAW